MILFWFLWRLIWVLLIRLIILFGSIIIFLNILFYFFGFWGYSNPKTPYSKGKIIHDFSKHFLTIYPHHLIIDSSFGSLKSPEATTATEEVIIGSIVEEEQIWHRDKVWLYYLCMGGYLIVWLLECLLLGLLKLHLIAQLSTLVDFLQMLELIKWQILKLIKLEIRELLLDHLILNLALSIESKNENDGAKGWDYHVTPKIFHGVCTIFGDFASIIEIHGERSQHGGHTKLVLKYHFGVRIFVSIVYKIYSVLIDDVSAFCWQLSW